MTAPFLRGLVQDSTTPAMRQLPSVAGLLLALVALPIVPNRGLSDPVTAWSGVALVLVATAVAWWVPWSRLPPRFDVVVPLLTLLAFGLFRAGTGGAQSLFTALSILPLLWLAAEPGRRWILLGPAATAVTLLLPYLLGQTPWDDGQVFRVFFGPLIYVVVAAVINELAHRSRAQVAEMMGLVRERESALQAETASLEALSRSSRRLQASEEFSQSVWTAIREEAVIVTDLDGHVVAWGPGAELMFGVSTEIAESTHTVMDFVDEAGLAGTGPVLARLLAVSGRPGGSEADILLRDRTGATVPVHLSCSPRRSADGDLVGHIFVAYDMTKAHEVARLKDEFVGTVSHELRTPLSSILGYLELVRDEDENLTDEQKHFLSVTERNAQRLLDLVGDLLFVAQVDAGRMPLQTGRVLLPSLISAAVESALPAAARRGIAVEVGEQAGGLHVHGDAGRLGQAIDNLISNAVKFSRPGGTVTVSLTTDAAGAVLSVSDNGIGIPAAEMDRLFSRFFRSSTATQRAIQGIGLGLNITRAIVTAHGGHLSVDSVEGEGTTFRLHLPLD